MKRTVLILLLLTAALAVFAGSRHRWDGGINCGTCVTPLVDDVTDCGDLRVIFDDRDAVRSEENVDVGDVRSLVIRASESGGIYVRRGDASRFSVRACKAAAYGEALAAVRVRVNGDNVTTTGPSGRQWLVYFLVEMPRGAKIDLGTTNGPIQVRGVDGHVLARAENGPVSAKESTGTIYLTTDNGPVAFSGSSGEVVLRTSNGPLAVDLKNGFWERGSLDGRTDNGPLALRIPRGYRSGVSVDTDGRSPVKCRAEDCRSGRMRYSDDDNGWPRHIDLGSGSRVVTLTTSNGPVAIDER
jgi:hypothetical protein